jgi:transposase
MQHALERSETQKTSWSEFLNGRNHLGVPGIMGRIILVCILWKHYVGVTLIDLSQNLVQWRTVTQS